MEDAIDRMASGYSEMPAEIFLDLLAERIAIKADKTVNLSLEIIGEKLVITPDREVAGVVVRGNEILAGRVRTKGGRWTDGNLTPQAIYNIAKEHVLAAGYNNREGKPRTAYGGRCQPVERIVVVGDGRYVVCNSSTSRASVGTSPHYLTLWSQPAQHTRYLLAAGRLALWRNAYANRRKQYVTGF